MITSMEELKMRSEAKIVKQKEGTQALEINKNPTLGERVREKWHSLAFSGGKSNSPYEPIIKRSEEIERKQKQEENEKK